MDKKILLQNLADSLAERTGMTKRKAEAFVRSFFEVTEESLAADGQTKVKGFGTTKIVNVSDRESVNINTGERIQIEGHAKVTFTPDALFRDLVNRPFAHFTTIVLDDEVAEDEETALFNAPAIDPEEETDSEAEVEETSEEEIPEEAPAHEAEEAPAHEAEEEPAPEVEEEAAPEVEEEPASEVEEEPASEAEEEAEEVEPIPSLADDEANCAVEMGTPKTPIIINNTLPEPRHNWWKTAFVVLAMCILALASYFAGYFRIFCPCNIIGTDAETVTAAEAQRITADSIAKAKADSAANAKADSLAKAKADSATAATQQMTQQLAEQQKAAEAASERLAAQQAAAEKAAKRQADLEAAQRYEQIPGSNYLITGTMQSRRIKTGENLYKIAKQMYGSKDFARYIAFYNNIEDPNHVCIGQTIKLPQLIRR